MTVSTSKRAQWNCTCTSSYLASSKTKNSNSGVNFRVAAGHSLLEIIFTLSLLITLGAVAAPSFAAFISRTQVSVQASALLETLQFARNTAITEHKIVQICELHADSERCSGNYNSRNNWEHGWLVYIDANENNSLDANDRIVRSHRVTEPVNIVFNQRGRLRFFPDGQARSAGFYLCNENGSKFSHLYLLHSGRARLRSELSKSRQQICQNPR